MSTEEATSLVPTEGLVVKTLDDYTVVIDKGRKDGVRKGQRFLIYSVS